MAGAGQARRVTDAFRSFVLDQLEELDEVTARSMFGAVGLYCRGAFFGIVSGDVLYLKVDEVTKCDFERAGMRAFKPYPDRPGTMQYYAVPVDVLESPADLVAWARRAAAVAERSNAPAARRGPRPTATPGAHAASSPARTRRRAQ